MDWRKPFLEHFGPGVLGGITLPDWLRLLRAEGAGIDFSRLRRAIAITAQSIKNTGMGAAEHRRYDAAIEKVTLQPPLFVLGHWRSGTTHLHELIAQDGRFAFPNTYQVSFPHTFLCTEPADARMVSFFIPKERPMDAMRLSVASPQEDEFGVCAASLKSPYLSMVFPRQRAKFQRYLTFRGVEAAEIAAWSEALVRLLKKVQYRSGRPLVVKSPPHTARLRLLLDLFPQARFVHIHRDPYRVFQSTRRLFPIMFAWHGLQRPPPADLDEWVLSQYREMYEAFFADRNLVPAGRLHEMSFEALEKDPVGEVGKMYEALGLFDFEGFRLALQSYVNSLAGYRKNTYADLPAELKARIFDSWRFCFEEWGYGA